MDSLIKTEGIPLYVKIREALRSEIISGGLMRGHKIPSEQELAVKYNVSRMTVRQGIADLITEGLLFRRQGRGTFVAYPHVERDHTRLTNFFETAKLKGINARAKVLDFKVVPARHRIAEALDLAVSDPVIQLRTVRYANEVPITVHDAYFPHHLFSSFLNQDMETQPLWELMEQAGYRVKRAIQRLEAREANRELAACLEIEPGAPILFKERTVYADDGTPVEFTFCYNRGDLYSLTISLER